MLADSAGKEVAVSVAAIRRRVSSGLSLMPGNFGELIPPEQFNDLVAYLLAH